MPNAHWRFEIWQTGQIKTSLSTLPPSIHRYRITRMSSRTFGDWHEKRQRTINRRETEQLLAMHGAVMRNCKTNRKIIIKEFEMQTMLCRRRRLWAGTVVNINERWHFLGSWNDGANEMGNGKCGNQERTAKERGRIKSISRLWPGIKIAFHFMLFLFAKGKMRPTRAHRTLSLIVQEVEKREDGSRRTAILCTRMVLIVINDCLQMWIFAEAISHSAYRTQWQRRNRGLYGILCAKITTMVRIEYSTQWTSAALCSLGWRKRVKSEHWTLNSEHGHGEREHPFRQPTVFHLLIIIFYFSHRNDFFRSSLARLLRASSLRWMC